MDQKHLLAVKDGKCACGKDMKKVDRSETIQGLSLGIWSENPQTALALGVVNGSTGGSSGLSWAFVLNYADSYKGVQWAAINYAKNDFVGWQGGILNYTDGSMTGLQSGLLNYARTFAGLQLGVVNIADTVESGVQLGLVNIMPENEWFEELPGELAPAMIFVNWRF